MYERLEKEIDNQRLAREINQELDLYRPKWDEFKKRYSSEEIKSDMQKLADYRAKKGYSKEASRDKLTDGLLIEKMFSDADENDLFCEDDLYDELLTESDDFLLYTIPTHEYDDTFNNADMVCLIKNSLTGHKIMPFVVDCTSNTSLVDDKMNYRRTKSNLKGFTELKYFRNTLAYGEEAKPWPIEKVPRFIVGFDAELARDILTDNSEWAQDENKEKYERAQYYIIKELAIQTKNQNSELREYFAKLLENFEAKHDTSLYSGDLVFNAIERASDKLSSETKLAKAAIDSAA